MTTWVCSSWNPYNEQNKVLDVVATGEPEKSVYC